jgi:hypothetical protein
MLSLFIVDGLLFLGVNVWMCAGVCLPLHGAAVWREHAAGRWANFCLMGWLKERKKKVRIWPLPGIGGACHSEKKNHTRRTVGQQEEAKVRFPSAQTPGAFTTKVCAWAANCAVTAQCSH